MAAILCAVQGGNWQRGGSKGPAPSAIKRPSDKPPVVRSGAELMARRAAMDAELARREAAARQRRKAKGA